MIAQIENLPENSLVLIEEIENGLHPVATIKMVEYLIDVADRKKIQSIFTTHSNDALKPLPSKAIWAALNGGLSQGTLDINSLRAITGQTDSQLVIFVEDKFSKLWVEAILKSQTNISIDSIEVHLVRGDGNAVKMHTIHNQDPSQKLPSVCFIDGDSEQKTSISGFVFRLPGESPENYIYNAVIEKLDEFKLILTVALHRPTQEVDKVEKIIREVKITNRDPHLLFSQVGMKVGLLPEDVVISAFLAIWTQAYPDECKKLLEPLDSVLPMNLNQA